MARARRAGFFPGNSPAQRIPDAGGKEGLPVSPIPAPRILFGRRLRRRGTEGRLLRRAGMVCRKERPVVCLEIISVTGASLSARAPGLPRSAHVPRHPARPDGDILTAEAAPMCSACFPLRITHGKPPGYPDTPSSAGSRRNSGEAFPSRRADDRRLLATARLADLGGL